MDDWVEDRMMDEMWDPDNYDYDDLKLDPQPHFEHIHGTIKYKTVTKNKKGEPKIIFQICLEKGFHSEPDIIETVATVKFFKAADRFDEGDYIYCVTIGNDGTIKNMIDSPKNHKPVNGYSQRKYNYVLYT